MALFTIYRRSVVSKMYRPVKQYQLEVDGKPTGECLRPSMHTRMHTTDNLKKKCIQSYLLDGQRHEQNVATIN